MNPPKSAGWGKAAIAILLLCLAVSLASVVYPMYVIRPFRAQGPQELQAALWVVRWRPVVTAVCAAIGVLSAISAWQRTSGRPRRFLVATGAVASCGLVLLGRVNIYELMFHPNEHPSFVGADAVKLEGDEKVIAVRLNGQARAYPVRSISYHHIINDEVAKRAIVATY